MDFEPRESQLVTFGKRAAAVCAVLLFALVLYWRSSFHLPFGGFGRHSMPLPSHIDTVADGYPIAARLKDRVATETKVRHVQVSLMPNGRELEAESFFFVFASDTGKRRTVMVSLLNAMGKGYAFDFRDNPQGPFPLGEASVSLPTPIDIPQVIEIANTNGLKAFRGRADPEGLVVALSLTCTSNGPVWQVEGNSWDSRQKLKQFHLDIDAQTGALLEDPTEKSAQH